MRGSGDQPPVPRGAFERLPDVPMIELMITTQRAAALVAGRWHQNAGGAIDVDGWPAALNFAPHRWLVDASGRIDVSDAVRAGAAVIDVEGRWARYAFRGESGRRTLAAATEIEGLLRGRRCAVTTIFDCPAVIAIVSGAPSPEWLVHVAVSYAASFEVACGCADRSCSTNQA